MMVYSKALSVITTLVINEKYNFLSDAYIQIYGKFQNLRPGVRVGGKRR